MAKQDHSALKVGIIAGTISTVIGGIILSPAFRASCLKAAVWIWKTVTGPYVVAGWYLALLAVLALVGGLHLFFSFWPQAAEDGPDYLRYTEDMIHKARWRWRYIGNVIHDVWCFCPRCEARLVWIDKSWNFYEVESKTDFACENCDCIVSSIKGGDKNYAIAAVTREVERRIRTGEYKRALPPVATENV